MGKYDHVAPAITVRQPWASAIMHLGKNIENRTWNTKHRGKIYIHASRTIDEDWRIRRNHKGNRMITHEDIKILIGNGVWQRTGVILGSVDIINVTQWHSRNKWFIGPYGFVLANPQPLPDPLECRGMPGIFKLHFRTIKRLPLEDWYQE